MTTQPPGRSFEEVRVLWQGRLDEARSAYEQAVAQTEAALKPGAQGEGKDPGLTRRLALFREASAREEYVRVLKVYADLVVRGIVPGE
ncbi:MAG TPA: hypothetical protein VMH28_27660 [Candidatus Acidoferrales bacterium]|nr:hypothetical protein [Candidatus Acidoferrales bacterium]